MLVGLGGSWEATGRPQVKPVEAEERIEAASAVRGDCGGRCQRTRRAGKSRRSGKCDGEEGAKEKGGGRREVQGEKRTVRIE